MFINFTHVSGFFTTSSNPASAGSDFGCYFIASSTEKLVTQLEKSIDCVACSATLYIYIYMYSLFVFNNAS